MVPNSTNNSTNQFQRLPTTAEFLEEEPLYVNAKQYKRILKRRQARAKLEAEGKIPKTRQVYTVIIIIFFINKRRKSYYSFCLGISLDKIVIVKFLLPTRT